MPEVQKVIDDLTAEGMSDARMAALLRRAAMLPQTLDTVMRSGMSDAEMACALRQKGAQGAIVFAANDGLPDSQMACAIGHAALRAENPHHILWNAVLSRRAWPAERTLMMRLASKGMRQLVKELRTPARVSRNALFWRARPDARTRTWHKKWDRNWWPPVMGDALPTAFRARTSVVSKPCTAGCDTKVRVWCSRGKRTRLRHCRWREDLIAISSSCTRGRCTRGKRTRLRHCRCCEDLIAISRGRWRLGGRTRPALRTCTVVEVRPIPVHASAAHICTVGRVTPPIFARAAVLIGRLSLDVNTA